MGKDFTGFYTRPFADVELGFFLAQVQAPAHLSDADLAPMIDRLKWRAGKTQFDDAMLERRARELNRQHLKNIAIYAICGIRWYGIQRMNPHCGR